jgi:hypothetical protein
VSFNPASHKTWRDEGEGISVDCGYEFRLPSDPYRFELASAPTVDFKADVALTLDEWITRWVQPLVEVTSLATRKREQLAWLMVLGREDPIVSGVVFGVGIEQAPYQATLNEAWQDPERRPLFTLHTIALDFPVVLRAWRTLNTSDNPFVELSRLALTSADLPGRARFLYLVQALEALHWFENRRTDERTQKSFEKQRSDLLAELEGCGLAAPKLKFLRNTWGSRKPENLERRLGALLKGLPTAVRADLERPELAPVADELRAAEKADTLQAQIRVLRNRLWHGTRNYSETELQPWVRVLEVLARAHLLQLLGFDTTAIDKALAPVG